MSGILHDFKISSGAPLNIKIFLLSIDTNFEFFFLSGSNGILFIFFILKILALYFSGISLNIAISKELLESFFSILKDEAKAKYFSVSLLFLEYISSILSIFSVIVPVLSVHRTSIAPISWTDEILFTITLCLESLYAPLDKDKITTVDKDSGITETASDIANNKIATIFSVPFKIKLIVMDNNKLNITINKINLLIFDKSFSKILCSSIFKDWSVIFPISVFLPVLITMPSHIPLLIDVPEKHILLAPNISFTLFFNVFDFLNTSTDSPVKTDSSTYKLFWLIILISAGTISPASNIIISPGTISVVDIKIYSLFLFTLDWDIRCWLRSSAVCDDLYSCINPKIVFIKTKIIIKKASKYCCRAKEIIAANNSK